MAWLLVCTVAVFASALTLVSGFGLGTLLMPAFAVFFPVPVAIAATAAVHLASNLFQLGIVGRFADRRVVLMFGVPAVVGALVGAVMLARLDAVPAIATYRIGSSKHAITWVKVVVATIVIGFAAAEVLLSPNAKVINSKWSWLGGSASGFFGGLSGHQGALRSAFLVRLGLSKEAYIGSGVVIGVMVDIARLAIYGRGFFASKMQGAGEAGWGLIAAASVAAFVGAVLGARLVKKLTIGTVRRVVAVTLVVMGVAMGSGLI